MLQRLVSWSSANLQITINKVRKYLVKTCIYAINCGYTTKFEKTLRRNRRTSPTEEVYLRIFQRVRENSLKGVEMRSDAVTLISHMNSMDDHMEFSERKCNVDRIELRIILVRLINSYKFVLCLRLQQSGTRCSLTLFLNANKPFPYPKPLFPFIIHTVRLNIRASLRSLFMCYLLVREVSRSIRNFSKILCHLIRLAAASRYHTRYGTTHIMLNLNQLHSTI